MKNKTIVIGCGRLGGSIANYAFERGENVVIIDSDPSAFDRLSDVFSGFKVCADATDPTVLEDAHIKTARDVLIATGDDNINYFLADLSLKVYQVPNIYVRFDDPDKSALIAGENIQAIYPFELSRAKFDALKKAADQK